MARTPPSSGLSAPSPPISGEKGIKASGRNRITRDIASPRESDLRQVGLRRQICPQICFLWRASVARVRPTKRIADGKSLPAARLRETPSLFEPGLLSFLQVFGQRHFTIAVGIECFVLRHFFPGQHAVFVCIECREFLFE